MGWWWNHHSLSCHSTFCRITMRFLGAHIGPCAIWCIALVVPSCWWWCVSNRCVEWRGSLVLLIYLPVPCVRPHHWSHGGTPQLFLQLQRHGFPSITPVRKTDSFVTVGDAASSLSISLHCLRPSAHNLLLPWHRMFLWWMWPSTRPPFFVMVSSHQPEQVWTRPCCVAVLPLAVLLNLLSS